MNPLIQIKESIFDTLQKEYNLSDKELASIEILQQTEKYEVFGDLSCNAALILAKRQKKSPRELAQSLVPKLQTITSVDKVEVAGPGFLNVFLSPIVWQQCVQKLYDDKRSFFVPQKLKKEKYLLEFVSANPTGPLHLGHGRGGIIGDVLARVLTFLGHEVTKEFYINDAGSQIQKLGLSLKSRCEEQLGLPTEFPEDGYHAEYLVDLAKNLIGEHGKNVVTQPIDFFSSYAKNYLLDVIKKTLIDYNITFNSWISEQELYKNGSIDEVIKQIKGEDLLYEYEGALWFRSTDFGDEKDRVIRKKNGEYTYLVADIAYHKQKFDRGYTYAIDILGQDHHGYTQRLKATLQALGYDSEKLHIILYQLVKITHHGIVAKMSKRAGTFTELRDVIEAVGVDVARFFYLYRKAEAHLDFDLESALKKTDENPVYYIQYAYVRTHSIVRNAQEKNIAPSFSSIEEHFNDAEYALIRKMVALSSVLQSLQKTYQTHQLAYYTLECAQAFHSYYTHNRIIDEHHEKRSQARLFLITVVKDHFELCLDLLGLSKPTSM